MYMQWPRLIGSISKDIYHLSLSVAGYIAAEYPVLCTGVFVFVQVYLGRQGPWGRQMSGFLFSLYSLYSHRKLIFILHFTALHFIAVYCSHLYSELQKEKIGSGSTKFVWTLLLCTDMHRTLLYSTVSYRYTLYPSVLNCNVPICTVSSGPLVL